MTHKLLIKTHSITGLKYLCYTKKKDHISYPGSGKLWIKHLEKNGYFFETELLFESNDYLEFKNYTIQKSIEYNIVDSDEWANLKLEEGDGGDTVSRKKWITDGKTDRYIDKIELLPEGWKYGRSNCIFNYPTKQKEFGLKADIEKRGKAIKKAWLDGKMDHRDHSKCGSKGDKHPAKRKEVRKKISLAAKKDAKNRAERIKIVKPWEYRWN